MTRSDFLLDTIGLLDRHELPPDAVQLINRMHSTIEAVYQIAFVMEKTEMKALAEHIVTAMDKASS